MLRSRLLVPPLMDDRHKAVGGYHTNLGQPIPYYFIGFIGGLIALGPFAMDAYLPAIPAMAGAFGVSLVEVNTTISLYLAGYGIGQFFGGSVSDQLGRKFIGILGLGLFSVVSLAIGFATSIEQVQVLRFVQALGGGFSTVVAMAALRDVYPPQELGRRFAAVTLIMLTAPLVAPAIGAWLLNYGWAWIFFIKAAYGFVLLVTFAFAIPETRRGSFGNISFAQVPGQVMEVVTRRVAGRRLPIRYAITLALSGSTLMTFLTNASFMYIEYFGLTPGAFPLVFSASVVGLVATNLISMRRLAPANAGRFFRYGLQIQLLGITLLGGIVALGWQSLWTVVPLITIIVSTLGLIGPSGSARFMGFFSQLAGTAASVQTTMTFLGGAFFGALTGLVFDGTLLPMVAVMFAVSLAANMVALSIPRSDSPAVGTNA